MRIYYPQLTTANVDFIYSPSGLGFMGLGRPVPVVTVRVKNVPGRFFALSALGVPTFTMPNFTATLTAEDMSG